MAGPDAPRPRSGRLAAILLVVLALAAAATLVMLKTSTFQGR